MLEKTTSRRIFAAASVTGAASFLLSARGAGTQATPDTQATPAAGAFPVSIDHAYGTTTIEARPERIVTVGWSSADAFLSLGVIPVSIPMDSYAGDDDGLLPWTHAALGDNPLPAVIDESAGIPFEAIIELQPDLIFGRYSGITQDEYNQLTQIAPTVAFAESPWTASWQDVVLTAGAAVGLAPEAEALVASTESLVAERAAEFPAIAGKSYIYGSIWDQIAIYSLADPRPQFLNSLGMVPSDFVTNLDVDDANPYFGWLSFERANELVADIVVFWFDNQEAYDTHADQFYLQAIPAFSEGRFVPIIGEDMVMATSAWSPLSIDYALDTFLPLLGAAAEKVTG
jgi:iron complex transport system substrate-binding protein